MTNKNTIFCYNFKCFHTFILFQTTFNNTGWEYNERKQGGFDLKDFTEQTPGPELVFVEGGRLTMGRVEEDVMYDWNNISKTVTVSSFYIDETEVRNIDYLEYLEWIKKHFVYENSPFFTGNKAEIYEKLTRHISLER